MQTLLFFLPIEPESTCMSSVLTAVSYDIWKLDDVVLGRFLSDHHTPGLNSVVTSPLTPIVFAEQLVSGPSRDNYIRQFLKTPLTDEFADMWMFDQAARIAILWRLSNLRMIPDRLLEEVSVEAARYGLMADCPNWLSWYTGLPSFRDITESSRKWITRREMLPQLLELGRAIGNITDQDWLLHKRAWYQTLVGERDQLRVFRRFLHLALVAAERQVFSHDVFGVTISDLVIDLECLIELVTDPATTTSAICAFLDRVASYSEDHPPHGLNDPLLKAPFAVTELIAEAYFTRLVKQAGPSLTDRLGELNQVDWDYLRELGPEYDPDLLVNTELLPANYTSEVVKRVADDDGRALLRLFCEARDNELRIYADNVFDAWAKAALYDQLYRSVAERRMSVIVSDETVADALLRQSTHILLLLDTDNDERMGLAQFAELLSVHVTDMGDFLTEQETEILLLLHEAWLKLRLDRPHRLPKPWKRALADRATRAALRQWLFTIIEIVLNAGMDDFDHRIGVRRQEAFHWMTCFTHWLTNPAITAEQITQFVTQLELKVSPTALTPWLRTLWEDAFSAVIPPNNSEPIHSPEDFQNHGNTIH